MKKIFLFCLALTICSVEARAEWFPKPKIVYDTVTSGVYKVDFINTDGVYFLQDYFAETSGSTRFKRTKDQLLFPVDSIGDVRVGDPVAFSMRRYDTVYANKIVHLFNSGNGYACTMTRVWEGYFVDGLFCHELHTYGFRTEEARGVRVGDKLCLKHDLDQSKTSHVRSLSKGTEVTVRQVFSNDIVVANLKSILFFKYDEVFSLNDLQKCK